MPTFVAYSQSSRKMHNSNMQFHYGFVSSLYLKGLKTPCNFKKQFIIYSYEDNYPRKKEVESFLRDNYSTLGYSHILITRTRNPYTLAGDFVIPSRTNFQRFLSFLRVISPNNSFLKFEAFHAGREFQSSTRYDSEDIPHFLSITKDKEVPETDLKLISEIMNSIARLKPQQEHRINNFYSYLEQSIRGPIVHRIIWLFIALESLFHLERERDNFTEKFCKRVAFTLEPSNKVEGVKFYNALYRAGKLRGALVHGALVDYKNIQRELIKLEPNLWRIGRLLILDRKLLKLFSSLDSNLEKYFKRLDAIVI